MIRRNSHIGILSFALCLCINLIFIGGCAQENPLLYDPTMRDSSVSIRFVNMSRDGLPKTFLIDGCRDFTDIQFGSSSDLQVNTIDSAHYSLLSNGTLLYSTKALLMQKLSFSGTQSRLSYQLPMQVLIQLVSFNYPHLEQI